MNVKLNLDFSLYKGVTKLKQWWKEVKAHFTQVQEAHNDLQEEFDTHAATSGYTTIAGHVKLSDGVNQTFNAGMGVAATPLAVKQAYDKAVEGVDAAATTQTSLDTEISDRQSSDNALQQNIDTEAAARQSADTTLQNNINDEISARTAAENALDGRVKTVEDKAHTHANKTALDGISETDIAAWNGIKEQVTQTQLDEAIAAESAARETADSTLQENIDSEAETRAGADNAIIVMLNAAKTYFEDMYFSFTDEFQRVYGALNITVFDGGIFGMAQSEIALDGGGFAEETTGNVDCGGFEPLTVGVGAVVDGGEY